MNNIKCELAFPKAKYYQGDIFKIEEEYYLLCFVVDGYLLISFEFGNWYDHPSKKIEDAVPEEAIFVGRDLQITIANKPLTK